MRERTTINTAASAIEIFSLIGAFGGKLFKAIGLIEFAQGLDGVMALFAAATISWPGVYLFLAILSGCALVANNYVIVTQKIANYRLRQYREWNSPAVEAVNYIAFSSYFSKTLNDANRLSAALAAFREAAESGRIKVAGRAIGKGSLTVIGRRTWKKNVLGYKSGQDYVTRYNTILELTIVPVGDEQKKKPIYEGLMVDRTEMHRVWPAPRSYISSRLTPSKSRAASAARKNVAANVPRLSLAFMESTVSSGRPCFFSLWANSS